MREIDGKIIEYMEYVLDEDGVTYSLDNVKKEAVKVYDSKGYIVTSKTLDITADTLYCIIKYDVLEDWNSFIGAINKS